METRSRRSTSSRIVSGPSSEYQGVATADDESSKMSTSSSAAYQSVFTGTGDTPLRTRGLDHLRQRIEEELGIAKTSTAISPGLTRLRNTPGWGLKEKQRELINKHEKIRQNSDKLSVGGGITLWPNMKQMRLSGQEMAVLGASCLLLMSFTGWLFVFLHGETVRTLWKFTALLNDFGAAHPIKGTGNIKSSVLIWHSNLRNLLDGIDKSLNVTRPTAGYQFYIASYVMALGVLVYFLVDNMFSSSKLSPGRIKKWVCLLVVVAQWTAMLCVMFVFAHNLETAVVHNVHTISEKLGEFVERDLDLSTLTVVVQYWRGRCLPPTSRGVVQVLGVVGVQDVAVYLQYYSLPVLTVLITPVIRLILAVKSIYT